MASDTQVFRIGPEGEQYNISAPTQAEAIATYRKLKGQSVGPDVSEQVLPNINAGIAEAVGGLVDFVNPFDKPFYEGGPATGSLETGLKDMMNVLGVETAGKPKGVAGSVGRGIGQAAGALVPVAKTLQGLKSVGGVTGAVAGDALKAIASKLGIATEVVAGGISEGARETTRELGGGEKAQNAAAMLAPMAAIPGAVAGVKGAFNVAERLPLTGAAIRGVKGAVTPMTPAGAREVARTEIQGLVGGSGRAAELAGTITKKNPLGLTPAEQTGNPALLGLQNSAGLENPVLGERLAARQIASRTSAVKQLEALGGAAEDAREFFSQRINQFSRQVDRRVRDAMTAADAEIKAAGPKAGEVQNSETVVRKIKDELAVQVAREKEEWAKVPRDEVFPTQGARDLLNEYLAGGITRAKRGDIPEIAVRLLGRTQGKPPGQNQIQDDDTVGEIYDLYSKLREGARNARAGDDTNRNMARISDEIADALLNDLGAVDGGGPAGEAINSARAFSRVLHEKFDQGAVGRILSKTITTEERLAAETALARTVGRGKAAGFADARNIERAASGTSVEIQDYLREGFSFAVRSADDEFTPKTALKWLRDNRELMKRYPKLAEEFRGAVKNRSRADMFSIRLGAKLKLAEDSVPGRFTLGPEEKAALTIIGADNPNAAAISAVREARKDPTGKALAGLRGSVLDYLIPKSLGADDLIVGRKLGSLLNEKRIKRAMAQVFDPGEMKNLNIIARELRKMDVVPLGTGPVMDSPGNRLISIVVRLYAAGTGGKLGASSPGGSLQSAGILTGEAQRRLKRLTNDKARELIMDAIEDRKLMKILLSNSPIDTASINRLAPYFVGGGAAVATGEEETGVR